jgi:hypothetical protein
MQDVNDWRTTSQLEWDKKMAGEWFGPERTFCPDDCCNSFDSLCQQIVGAHGYSVNSGEEIMVIHGG